MKRIFIVTLTLLISMTVFAVSGSDKFIDALRTCSFYQDNGTVNIQGISAQVTKVISGWQNGACVYKEKINLSGINTTVACRFTKQHINEITNVADAYFLTLKYSGQEADISSMDAMQNNPLANVFNKYLQDPSVCSIGGLE